MQERTPVPKNDEGGKIRGLLARGQEQRGYAAVGYQLSAFGEYFWLIADS
jgi:hypothetical protein